MPHQPGPDEHPRWGAWSKYDLTVPGNEPAGTDVPEVTPTIEAFRAMDGRSLTAALREADRGLSRRPDRRRRLARRAGAIDGDGFVPLSRDALDDLPEVTLGESLPPSWLLDAETRPLPPSSSFEPTREILPPLTASVVAEETRVHRRRGRRAPAAWMVVTALVFGGLGVALGAMVPAALAWLLGP